MANKGNKDSSDNKVTLLIVEQAPKLHLSEGIETELGRKLLSNLGQEWFLRLLGYSYQPITGRKKILFVLL